jgi:amino acid permease
LFPSCFFSFLVKFLLSKINKEIRDNEE